MNTSRTEPGTAVVTYNVGVFVGASYVRKANGVVECFRDRKRAEDRLCRTRIVAQEVRRWELEAFYTASAHQEARVHDKVSKVAFDKDRCDGNVDHVNVVHVTDALRVVVRRHLSALGLLYSGELDRLEVAVLVVVV